jgi:dihydrofolate reductase
MRKVILGVAVTLDGFIEGLNGEYDWCLTDQDYGMSEFLDRIDSIFLGRKSYELVLEVEKKDPAAHNPFREHKHYVFSNSLRSVSDGMILISGDVKTKVNEIKSKAGKDIWLFGGASLTTYFINEGLLDEMWLAIHPILLGSGKKLFSDINRQIKLSLLDSKTYSTGLISMTYALD